MIAISNTRIDTAPSRLREFLLSEGPLPIHLQEHYSICLRASINATTVA
jgi:hypothetical protein